MSAIGDIVTMTLIALAVIGGIFAYWRLSERGGRR